MLCGSANYIEEKENTIEQVSMTLKVSNSLSMLNLLA